MRVVTTRLGGAVQRRGFASTARRLDNYAFIGLGQMGYQMAKNLQSKLKPTDQVSIFDINTKAMQGLEAEMRAASTGASVALAPTAFDASKDAVSFFSLLLWDAPHPIHCASWDFYDEQPLFYL